MQKPIATTLSVTFPMLMKTARLKAYGLIAIVLLTGCTATVVRWNSVKMREEIIAYYNDEIMDNLIRMSEGLPFVHVDISSVSAAGVSQVSGTVGAGETESFTKTSPSSSMMGALHTITRAATAPFAYSVTPLHSDTLTMTAVPVIGPLPADNETTSKTTKTEVREPIKPDPEGKERSAKTTTTEVETKPPSATSVYSIYKRFLCEHPNALVYSPLHPNKKELVPGTLKRHGTGFYYIRKADKAAYTNLYEGLLTQSRGKPAGKTLNADVEVLKAQGLVPPTPRQP